MTLSEPNSPEALSEEILAEAGRQSNEIIRRAQQESGLILAAAMAETDKLRREHLDSARAEAARRSELILATIPVETGRLRSARIEAILENLHEEARHELQLRTLDGHEIIVTLSAEAVRRMPGTDFVLKISAADQAAFGDKLAEEVRQRAGRSPLNITITADSTVTDADVVIKSADGFQIWDNRLLSRLERLWPELRRQIASQTSLAALGETSKVSMIPESQIVAEESADARQRLGVLQSSGAFTPTDKAAEGCRSPKPGGSSDNPGKGDT